MNIKDHLNILLILTLTSHECVAKGGRFSGGRFGGGGKSGGSRSNGSKNNSPSSPSSQANNANTQIGWNTQNMNQPNNVNSQKSSPIGPPPAYPGLHNQPVFSEHKPPPYSPSFSSNPIFFAGSNSYKNPNYGPTFGSKGLPGNTFISNNFYKTSSIGIPTLLANALFFGGGLHTGYILSRRKWSDDDDYKWRATTKAPYFENKVPGSEIILPASAVVGAATAFGLASLLPLNVPSNKPLMYCNQNSTDIAQAQILFNRKIYKCINETILISDLNCPKVVANKSTTETLIESTTESEMSTEGTLNKTEAICNETSTIMQCDSADNIYCSNGTLLSRIDVFCNSTNAKNSTLNANQTYVLNCYEGSLPVESSSFIPTTTPKPNQKSLSFASKTHVFLLKLLGKHDILEIPETTTILPDKWIPEALTFPPPTDNENFQRI